MILSLLNLWQADAASIPVWIAVVGVLAPILLSILAYFFGRSKQKAETLSLQGKNKRQDIENFDFGNETLNRTAAEIERLRQRELDLTSDVHRRDITIKTLEFEKAEVSGQIKLVLQEKELILNRVDELKKQVDEEKRECFKKINELATNHQTQIDFLQEQLKGLTERLQHYESEVEK